MSLLVALGPADDQSTVEFAAALARSSGQDLHTVSVVPAPWPRPIPGGVDKEYAEWAAEQGRAACATARGMLDAYAEDLTSHASWVRGRSVPSALRREAAKTDAAIIILGTTQRSSLGRVALGSTADALLHSSPIPVAVVPRGYRTPQSGRVGRVSFAFRGDAHSVRSLRRTAAVCQQTGTQLRVVTFSVPGKGMFTAGVGFGDDMVRDQWIEDMRRAQARAVGDLADLALPTPIEQVVARGADWNKALHRLTWGDDDVLVIGSSKEGRLMRLFLGPTGTKIVRAAQVPVIIAR